LLYNSDMHTRLTPVHRKHLADPAACGVRLGVELRAAAEQAAYSSGMCLSHWIKRVVEEALSKSGRARKEHPELNQEVTTEPQSDSAKNELNSEFAKEMEKLNDR
jgi:hypothetical protein